MLKKAALWGIVVVIIYSVFFFSSEPGKASQDRSYKITEFVARESKIIIDRHTLINKLGFDKLHYYIRKSGHFFEYMLLAIFIVVALSKNKADLLKLNMAVFLLCLVLACVDEWVQTFTTGRSGSIKDVLIDGTGALIGIILCDLMYIIIEGLKYNLKRVSR